MENAWTVIKPYADETAQLRAEIRALRRMIDSCNEAFTDLAERHVIQTHLVEEQQMRLDELYSKLEEFLGEID